MRIHVRAAAIRLRSLAIIAAAGLTIAGCSAEITRLDHPFFGKEEPVRFAGRPAGQFTGSLPPTPHVSIANSETQAAAPSGTLTSASLEPITGEGGTPTAAAAQQDPRAASDGNVRTAAAPQPAQGQPRAIRGVHRVQPGETMVSIARRYQVSAFQIAEANDMRATDALRTGQDLNIPANGQQAQGEPIKVASLDETAGAAPIPAARPATTPDMPRAPQVKEPSIEAKTPARRVQESSPPDRSPLKPRARQVAARTPLPDPEPVSEGKLRWPVRGRIISEFGPKPNGAHNDGINIAVPEGTSIKAAENGVVAYAGNELKGYGNLILIRHDDGMVTAYAHASEIGVKRGDPVVRGQIIGKAGQTGSVSQPQLHFEVRKNSRPVDPKTFMAGL